MFDRSHYEDLIVPLATGQIDGRALDNRAREVNLFEHEVVEDGTVVIKCMLHISFDEQRETEFQDAYAAVIGRTSTAHAPWFVVPSDLEWYRNWAVASILVESPELDLHFPQPDVDIAAMRTRVNAS